MKNLLLLASFFFLVSLASTAQAGTKGRRAHQRAARFMLETQQPRLQVISGTLTDAAGLPQVNAQVADMTGNFRTYTDSLGHFQLHVRWQLAPTPLAVQPASDMHHTFLIQVPNTSLEAPEQPLQQSPMVATLTRGQHRRAMR